MDKKKPAPKDTPSDNPSLPEEGQSTGTSVQENPKKGDKKEGLKEPPPDEPKSASTPTDQVPPEKPEAATAHLLSDEFVTPTGTARSTQEDSTSSSTHAAKTNNIESSLHPGVPFLVPGLHGFRLELLTRDDSHSPFLTVGAPGRFGQAFLARVVTDAGDVLKYLVLKVQRDLYASEEERAGRKASLSNKDIEELWEKEYLHLKTMSRETTDSVASYINLTGSSNGTVPTFDPLFFCREKKAFFHIPSPDGNGNITDEVDDEVLYRAGLVRYSQSTIRYISCKVPGQDTPAFYRNCSEEDAEKQQFKTFLGLLGDLREWWAAKNFEKANSKERFFCTQCDKKNECYAGKDSSNLAQRLLPFSFHRFRLLPMEFHPLHLHEFSDVLGGMTWKELQSTLRSRGAYHAPPNATDSLEEATESMFLSDLKAHLEDGGRLLFSDDPSGSGAVEVLKLKLALFDQTVQCILDFHSTLKRPHLDLKPENILVSLPWSRGEMPQLWNFNVHLIDLATTIDFKYGSSAHDTAAAIPLGKIDIYTSSIIDKGKFGEGELPCSMVIKEISTAGTSREQSRITAHLQSDSLAETSYVDKDLFKLTFTIATGNHRPRRMELWGRATPGDADGNLAGSLVFKSDPTTFSKEDLEALRNLQTNAWIIPHHVFHVPCDGYSTGMLLFRILFSGSRMPRIKLDFLEPLARDIERYREKHPEAKQDELIDHATGLLVALCNHTDEKKRLWVDPSFIFYHHESDRPNAIPPDVWLRVLLVGIRLVTNIPEFSFAAHRGDYSERNPEELLRRVKKEVKALSETVHGQLFQQPSSHREVREAIRLLVKRLEKEI